jgi:DNA mismatch repair ATPase MutL
VIAVALEAIRKHTPPAVCALPAVSEQVFDGIRHPAADACSDIRQEQQQQQQQQHENKLPELEQLEQPLQERHKNQREEPQQQLSHSESAHSSQQLSHSESAHSSQQLSHSESAHSSSNLRAVGRYLGDDHSSIVSSADDRPLANTVDHARAPQLAVQSPSSAAHVVDAPMAHGIADDAEVVVPSLSPAALAAPQIVHTSVMPEDANSPAAAVQARVTGGELSAPHQLSQQPHAHEQLASQVAALSAQLQVMMKAAAIMLAHVVAAQRR